MQVLLVNPPEQALPLGLADVLVDVGWGVTVADDYGQAVEAAHRESIDAVVMAEPDAVEDARGLDGAFTTLIELIDTRRIAAVMLSGHAAPRLGGSGTLLDVVGRDVSLPELRGRLATIERYHGQLKRLEGELENMQRIGKRLNEHFREIDQEMKLAGRLQRDFLPQITEPIGNARFATVFRPASWVSGDMFDVFRLDPEHTGFYVADAVGHGMAAGLLTMFIKRTITPEQTEGSRGEPRTSVRADSHERVASPPLPRSMAVSQPVAKSPSQAMAALNDALAAQSLPNCQFVTACYAILNHRTLELQYARGGHPFPLLIGADGAVRELKSAGGLLGLAQGEQFPTAATQLKPGDKLILYTDGLDLAFDRQGAEPSDPSAHHAVLSALSGLPVGEMLARFEARLDDTPGSLSPYDDITILGLEILE